MVSFTRFLLAAPAFFALASAITVNTPASLIECQPTAISWTGATNPVYVSILKGGDTSSAALEQLGAVPTGSSATWIVDLPAGTVVTIRAVDATGAPAYSSNVTVMAGSSTSCMNASSSASASSASATGSSGSGTSAAASASATKTSAAGLTVSTGIQGVAASALLAVAALAVL